MSERFYRNFDRFNRSPVEARRVVKWWNALTTPQERTTILMSLGSDDFSLSGKEFTSLPIEWQRRLELFFQRDSTYRDTT